MALTESDAIVSYTDQDQAVSEFAFDTAGAASASVGSGRWSPNWISGTGPLLNAGERVEITVNLDGLTQDGGLGTSEEFTIQVKPAAGAVLTVTRTVPAELTAVVDLHGPLSSGGSKETRLEGTAASIALRGSVIGHTDGNSVDYITFRVSNASQTGESMDMSSDAVVVSYTDADSHVSSFSFASTPATTADSWGTKWLSGPGPLLQPGERVEITINLQGLRRRLGTSKEFTIEVRPSVGTVLKLSRTTPAELAAVVDLQ